MRPLRVGITTPLIPWVFKCAHVSFAVRKNCRFPGIVAELWDEVAKKANISYIVYPLPAQNYGTRLANGAILCRLLNFITFITFIMFINFINHIDYMKIRILVARLQEHG